MDCDVCSLYSYDPDTETLSLAATQGLPARSIGRVSMKRSEGLVGLVVDKAGPVVAEDALAHERFKFFPELAEEKYHSFLAVPVGDPDNLLGVLAVQTRRRRRFVEQDERLLTSVAGHIRATMVNAHLSERLQREEKERDRYRREMVDAIQRLKVYEASRPREASADEEDGDARLRFSGLGASPGFGIGPAHCLLPQVGLDDVPLRTVSDPIAEQQRFDVAMRASVEEVENARERMRKLVPEVGGAIYEALRMIIEDKSLSTRVAEEIGAGLAAESALAAVIKEYAERFERMSDPYLKERAVDVRDVGQRILRHLLGVEQEDEPRQITEDAVLVASELTLTDFSTVDPSKLRAIVTESGGTTSHAAILAKSLEIPTVVGCEGLLARCCEGDDVIADGNTGTVYVRPSQDVLAEYVRLKDEYVNFQRELEDIRDLPAETLDGHRVGLMANVGLLGELDFVDRYGAEGIGLYRTELSFLSYRDFPSEEEQLSLYRKIIKRMDGRPITIRTLDLGADKYPAYMGGHKEQNPFLGWRSIRVSLELESLFKEQLRAILCAGADASVRIMFPMITSVEEIRRVREIYAECVADLSAEGQPPSADVELGVMMEVPAAVMRASQIVREVDFVSIGTNDLIQYILAVDRDNRKIAPMYEPLHPAVLQAIHAIVEAAHDAGRRVGMCGEMAGNPLFTLFLVGVGLDELSMGSQYIPVVKKLIRGIEVSMARRIAADLLRFDTVEEIKGYMFMCLRQHNLIELVEAFS